MTWQARIEQTPEVLGGQPVVRGTRVSVRVLVGGLAGGMTVEEVCASYRVTPEDVRAASATRSRCWERSGLSE